MEGSMNLIILLGAAAGSEEFCELLFEDPLKAAQLLNIALTESELYQVQRTFTAKKREPLCSQFGKIRLMLCKRPPCPYVVVIPKHRLGLPEAKTGRKDFRKSGAAA
jgi:hypothetical protein